MSELKLYKIPDTSDDNSSAIQDIVDTIGSIGSKSTTPSTGTSTPSTGITEQQVRDIVNAAVHFQTGQQVMMDGLMRSQNFYTGVSGWQIDADGNVEFGSGYFRGDITGASGTFSGTLTATTGVIGGFTINATSLSTGAFDTLNTMYFGASGLSLSNTFKVNNAGALTATGATISGAITATSGVIGGFTITATELYGGIIKTAATVGAGSNGVIMDSAGIRMYDDTLGEVVNLPSNGSRPTFASGDINETTFNITNAAVLQTSDHVGDGGADSQGVLINNSGIFVCENNQLVANANVKLLKTGEAVIKMNVKGGQTDFNTGIGYFLGLSGGVYKQSIGDPDGDHMNWDGSHMKLKGSFDVGQNGLINNSVYTVALLPVSPTVTAFLVPSSYE